MFVVVVIVECSKGRGFEVLDAVGAELAAALGVDPRTITASIENGYIPSVRLGRRVVIPREKFLRLFDADGTPTT